MQYKSTSFVANPLAQVEDAIEEVRRTAAGHVVFRHDEPSTRVKDGGYVSVLGLLSAGTSAKTLRQLRQWGKRSNVEV